MKLELVYDEGESSAVTPAHCSISLPVPVASSLAAIQPFAALVILRLEPLPVETSSFTFRAPKNNVNEKRPPIFVAWTGGTVDKPYSLGMHPAFAEAFGFIEGITLVATVVERVVSKRANRTVQSAVLRPAIYDACQKAVDVNVSDASDGERGPNAASNPDDLYEKAVAQFSVLSSTADALERTILNQVRVLFTGLVFPLRLPGRDSILVRVTNLKAVHGGSLIDESPYALLAPDSEIEVESPPLRPGQETSGGQNVATKVCDFYRVLPYGKSTKVSLPAEIMMTHAILPLSDAGSNGCARSRYALVSRKNLVDKQLALPVAVAFHIGVPERHVSLPPMILRDLKLAQLTPVLVDEVPPFKRGEQKVIARRLPKTVAPVPVSWAQFSDASGVYYHGMCLKDLQVCLNSGNKDSSRAMQSQNDVDLWDREGSTEKGVSGDNRVDNVFAAVEGYSRLRELHIAKSKRRIEEGLRSFQGQRLLEVEVSCTERIAAERVLGSPSKSTAEHPFRWMETEKLATLSLTASGRHAIEAILTSARAVFSRQAKKKRIESACEAVALEGPLGSGKTHVCQAVASLLRELARVRTVWIRGKAHSGEGEQRSSRRICQAFSAAADGGPGVVVIDDADMLFNSRKSSLAKETDGNDGANNRQGMAIAQVLEHQIKKHHPESVFVIMTCEKASDLAVSLRSPGILQSVVQLPLPSANERALLFWMALQELATDEPTSQELLQIRRDVSSLRKISEGYTPKDIHVSVKRAQIALELTPTKELRADMVQIVQVLTDVVKKLTPSTRSGITFTSQKPGESLTWSKIGGLANAKSGIWEALQLPAARPDVFTKTPIRLPHGVLLYGPPGCGKTMLARTAASESRMRCVMVKGPELLSKYIGESEAEVRRAFEKAANSAPCILLFDEFDSLAPRRGGESTGVADRVVNTLLTCMDGAERLSDGVYIVATTSRPELIDPALLRPGRLDRWIPVDMPATVKERVDILRCICTSFFPMTSSIEESLEQVARDTNGYTGADLGAIMNDTHLRYGKQRSGPTRTKASNIVPKLLKDALRDSRPSLSRSQRDYFEGIMARFAPQEFVNENGSLEAKKQLTEQLFGKRVALQ